MVGTFVGWFGRFGVPAMVAGSLLVAAPVRGMAQLAPANMTSKLTVTISPPVIALDNPTLPEQSKPSQRITISVAAQNAAGQPVLPSLKNPIRLRIYEPKGGPVGPAVANITSSTESTANFVYSGAYFQNAMLLTAEFGDSTATASIVGQNPLQDCQLGETDHAVRFNPVEALAEGFRIPIRVGGGPIRWVQLDTGSTGLTIDGSALGPEAVGPGAPFSRTYYPSRATVQGNRWLAPITIYDRSLVSLATTVPIEVNAVTTAGRSFALMGIGFDRPDGMPSDNPFLQLTDIVEGQTSPGYVLSPDRVDIGLDAADTGGFRPVRLPWLSSAGDWLLPEGCLALTSAGASQRECGLLLLDIGIGGMLFRTAEHDVPLRAGLNVDIRVTPPLRMSYGFTWQGPTKTLTSIQPTFLEWADPPAGRPPVLINIGRSPLARFGYSYDARCGHIGFLDRAAQ